MCRRSVFTITVQEMRIGFRRDKDIPQILAGSLTYMGFFGSDVLAEAKPEVKDKLLVMPLMRLGARFAIASRMEEAKHMKARLEGGEPLVFSTSNARQLEAVAQARGFKIKDIDERIGGVEAAPDDNPSVDVIFDIVDSGRTLKANNLALIADNLQPIYILNGWKKPDD